MSKESDWFTGLKWKENYKKQNREFSCQTEGGDTIYSPHYFREGCDDYVMYKITVLDPLKNYDRSI